MNRRSVFAAVGVGLMLSGAAGIAGPLHAGAINAIASLTFASTPSSGPGTIAPTGTLVSPPSAGATVAATVTARDSGNATIPNAVVYLWFTVALPGANGSTLTANQSYVGSGPCASNAACPVGASPTAYTADGGGVVTLSFTRGAKPAPGGSDVITAQDAASSPAVTAQDKYSYVKNYVLTPLGPKMATDGSLAANSTTNITVTAVDDNGTAAPNAKVAMSFTQGSGATATAAGKNPAVALTAVQQTVDASNTGTITVAYTTPATLPTSGTDSFTAANQISATPTLAVSDSYTYTAPPPPPPGAPGPGRNGYYMVASDGGIFTFGSQPGFPGFYGSTGNIKLNKPIVGMAVMPDQQGYLLVASDGGIFNFGSAVGHFYGSTGNLKLNAPIVGMALMPNADGYFLVASDGGIFSFGSAIGHFHGSMGAVKLNAPVVGMAITNDGDGYFMVATDGGIFTFGTAQAHFHGSMGGVKLNQPVNGMALTPDGDGYYEVASDGGIFSFGSAAGKFYGSMGGTKLNQPVVGMAEVSDGLGYYMVASDGGIFSFGSAQGRFYGSMGATKLNQPMVGMASVG